MSQPSYIMAFRKRMVKRGYENVSIRKLKNGDYVVLANEPFSGGLIGKRMRLSDSWTSYFR